MEMAVQLMVIGFKCVFRCESFYNARKKTSIKSRSKLLIIESFYNQLIYLYVLYALSIISLRLKLIQYSFINLIPDLLM